MSAVWMSTTHSDKQNGWSVRDGIEQMLRLDSSKHGL